MKQCNRVTVGQPRVSGLGRRKLLSAVLLGSMVVLAGCNDNGGAWVGDGVGDGVSASGDVSGQSPNAGNVTSAPMAQAGNGDPAGPQMGSARPSPLNGLTFAEGDGLQTQPRADIDQHGSSDTNLTLAGLQNEIFGPRCSVCHNGVGNVLPGSMDFTSAPNTAASLINVESTEYPQLLLISPGMSTNSYIIRKIEGTQLVGERMPRQGVPLNADQVQAVKAWIDEGALP